MAPATEMEKSWRSAGVCFQLCRLALHHSPPALTDFRVYRRIRRWTHPYSRHIEIAARQNAGGAPKSEAFLALNLLAPTHL